MEKSDLSTTVKEAERKQEGKLFQNYANKTKTFPAYDMNKANLVCMGGKSQRITEFGGQGKEDYPGSPASDVCLSFMTFILNISHHVFEHFQTFSWELKRERGLAMQSSGERISGNGSSKNKGPEANVAYSIPGRERQTGCRIVGKRDPRWMWEKQAEASCQILVYDGKEFHFFN